MIENRAYFPKISKAVERIRGYVAKEVVVGPEVTEYLESKADLSRLVYPMRNGVIERGDERGWRAAKELLRYSLLKYVPERPGNFDGFYAVTALAAQAPTYMYEKFFQLHEEINQEEGRLVKALTIIPQPLAVAIAEKATVCTVLEAGHGNTQITPISKDVIRGALIPLNRGGYDSDRISAQILKDLGYSDLAKEEKFVRLFKELAGLVPRDLEKAISWAKENPGALASSFQIPQTTVRIDMENKAWLRFLIGEFYFNPNHEIFESYYSRGFSPPKDTLVAGEVIRGNIDLGEAIHISVSKTPVEIQPQLLKKVILSGGAFYWKVPSGLEQVAVDSPTKIKLLLERLGITSEPKMVSDPQFSVWRGAIVYGYYLSEDYRWDWRRMEGWYFL
ncbi:MAG: hypothetical protein DRO05_05010 [Thermoproteota archaeon]|nr:MAG: hypothetical protein DRO05_05010 [Candidatus Korarchaeota archaeon]